MDRDEVAAQLKCAEAIGEYIKPLLPDDGLFVFKVKVRRGPNDTIELGDMTLVKWPEWSNPPQSPSSQ